MIAATALLSVGAVANGPGGDETTFTVDTKKSQVKWTGKKVTGEHTGTLGIKSGTVTFKGANVSSTNLKLDMSSITVTDIEDETYNEKLVAHLNSDDFFSTKKNPTATFVATSFVAIKGAVKGAPNYTVTGKLTIKGITNPISFPAIVEVANGELIAHAKATFDRTKWNVKYGSGSFFDDLGDKAIYDDVEFEFQLVARVNK